MNWYRLCHVLTDTDASIRWIQSQGLLPTAMLCPLCGNELTPKPCQRTCGRFRCRRGHSEFSQAITSGTWFENIRLLPQQVVILTYCFARKLSYEDAMDEASIVPGTTVSKATVADWYSYCREVCTDSLAALTQTKIGGRDHTVEIDECKIGRRKYHRGRIVEGTWILGMVDVNTHDLRLAVCPNNRRDKETLLRLTDANVEKGTTLYTDCWKGYSGLSSEGFRHMTVNHGYHYVDPDTGVTTNHIESRWRPLCRELSRGGVTLDNMAHHLTEYLWRLDVRNKSQRPFERLLDDIRHLYPPAGRVAQNSLFCSTCGVSSLTPVHIVTSVCYDGPFWVTVHG